jgi:hypothetical protein
VTDDSLRGAGVELAEVPRSRVFRQIVAIEVIVFVGPKYEVPESRDLLAGADVESIVRDAVQSNNESPRGLWLQAGETAWTTPEELTP